jgi:hypothetical protein
MSAAIAPLATQQHAVPSNNLKRFLTGGLTLLHRIPTIGNSFNLKFLLRGSRFLRSTRKVTEL